MAIDRPTPGPRMFANITTIILILVGLIAVRSSFSIVQPGNVGVVFNHVQPGTR